MLDLSIYRSVPLWKKRTFSPFFPASVIFFTQVKWMYFDIIFVPQKSNKVNAYYFESYSLPSPKGSLVEAQATMFHFPQAKNSTCALASPLPTKAIRLCGDPLRGGLYRTIDRTIVGRGLAPAAKLSTSIRANIICHPDKASAARRDLRTIATAKIPRFANAHSE